MRQNKLRERFQNGLPAIGTFVNTPTAEIVEALGWAGVDFALIDCEHALIPVQNLGNLIRAAEISNLTPIIRVPYAVPQNIYQALDAGALGVQVPQVHNSQTAEAIVQASRYPPAGLRGLAPLRPSRYGAELDTDYFSAANEAVLVVVQIESPGALIHLESIVNTKGIDVIFAGPLDLSIAMGVPGKTDHPKVQQAIKWIMDETRAAGKVAGIAVATIEEAMIQLEQGFTYITIGSDIAFITQCANELAELSRKYLPAN